ncbi:MAG: hypothetical protein WCX27_00610 [Candidatus Paceibacterota bacterium]
MFPKEREKACGYLTVRDGETGAVILVRRIGHIPGGKEEKYLRFSLEKGERLFKNRDHNSSWQSRDDKKEHYGGAIRVVRGIPLSFSGLSEHGDETILLVPSVMLNLLTAKEAKWISGFSNNNFLEPFMSEFMSTMQ